MKVLPPSPRVSLIAFVLAAMMALTGTVTVLGGMVGAEADGPDTGSRAEGAEDIGNVPGTILYYKDGYPPKPNVIYTFNFSFSMGWRVNHATLVDRVNRVINFGDRFYDATDGQMAIERVDVWNDQNHWDVTDVRFYQQSGRAFTYRGGITSTEAHIFLFGGDGGKVLHHEWGHYAMFLPDEYTDAGGAFCTCIMGSTWNTDQYCCESNHNSGHQYAEPNSCWKQIANRYTHVVEKDPPVSGPHDEPPITFIWHELLDFDTRDANMTIEPANPNEGDTVHINVSYFNLNYSIDDEQDFALYNGDPAAGGKVLLTQPFDVRDRTEFTVSFQWNAKAGLNDFYVIADPQDVVAEIDEGNNVAKGQVYVNTPPVIDPSIPGKVTGHEDTPLVVDLGGYGSDAEDATGDLVWEVVEHDDAVIVDVAKGPGEHAFTFEPLQDWNGLTTVRYRLTDTDGAWLEVPMQLDFEAVNDIPWVTDLTVDKESVLRGGLVEVALRGDDIETEEEHLKATIEYRETGGDWVPLQVGWFSAFQATIATTGDWALGPCDIRGMVTDAHDGGSEWYLIEDAFLVNNNGPSVTGLSVGEEFLYRTESTTVQMAGEDLEDGPEELFWEVEVQYPDGVWVPHEGDLDLVLGYRELEFAPDEEAQLGLYRFRARVSDADGNHTDWSEAPTDLIVMNNLPVTGTIEVSRYEVLRTESVTITVSGSDVETAAEDMPPEVLHSTGAGWQDNLLGDAVYDEVGGAWSITFQPTASTPTENFVFKVRFTDGDGESSEWKESRKVLVKNNHPKVVLEGPDGGKTREALQFKGSGSTDVEGELVFQWSFGDGGTANTADPVHEYREAGNFLVTLTVKDGNGIEASDIMTVTITKRPDDGPGPIIGPTGGGGFLGGYGLLALILILAIVVIAVVAYAMVRSRRRKDSDNDDTGTGMPPPEAPPPAGTSLLDSSMDPGEEGDGMDVVGGAPVDGDFGPPPPGPDGGTDTQAPPSKDAGPVEGTPPPGPPPPGPSV